ncbi:MAG: purine-nucleoside phosphorylase [Bacteroidetes bacterium]|nr:purine-nucleoside phosphorylase [Bacteroidota bacterium]MDE2672721.1 purine-nucleoside phosphorylase [Bacteroidota bacterium]
MNSTQSGLKSASRLLLGYLGGGQPSVAIVLGSGLDVQLDNNYWEMPASEIPGFVLPTVDGHIGRVTAGTLGQRDVLLIQGRVHCYEGIPEENVAFQVHLVRELGISNIVLVSAAGGIRDDLDPGSMMLVEDHLCAQPLQASAERGAVYDAGWRRRVIAASDGLRVSCGVFVWTIGPSYETPAEIVAFERRGGNAVGMSLVPEALWASALGMRVFAAAIITNRASGLSKGRLGHAEVLRAALDAQANVTKLLVHAVAQSPKLHV